MFHDQTLTREAVLFKFRHDTSEKIKSTFLTELRKLRDLPCVLNHNLVVGGPSITTPITRSKGFHFCLLSYHKDAAALDEYQASAEHHQYVVLPRRFSTYNLLGV